MTISFRSIVIGLLLIPLNSMWLALAEVVWYSGEPTTLSLFANVIFILCLLIIANAPLKRFKPEWVLSPAELTVIYVMLATATSLGGHDMLSVLMATVPHLHRNVPLNSRYEEVASYVPKWLVVTDPKALESAYVGQESVFNPTNFLPWLTPLAWWFAFVMALCSVYWGLTLIFRKQWTVNEKLAYPIIQTPLMLISETKTLARSRAFWAAFSIASLIDIINGLNVLHPVLPRIPIVRVVNLQTLFTERPWTDMGEAWISFFPCVIGICFLMPLDLSFSCWFFFLITKVQLILTSYFGVAGMPGFPYIQEQAAGGYYAIALIALWISRREITRIARIWLGKPVESEDPWERKEARIALVLLVAGSLFLAYFCLRAGMSLPIVVAFFGIHFVLSIAISRMRAELGPPSHDLFPVGAHRQLIAILGPVSLRNRNPVDVAMFGLLNFFNRCMRTHPMPQGIEGFRMVERLRLNNFHMLIAMALAIIFGTVTSMGALLWSYNRYGISAQVSNLPQYLGAETWDAVATWIQNPPRWIAAPSYAILVGLLFALGLSTLRMNLTWWPLHPVGFAISGSYTMMRMWFCVFLAWAAKALILKYGGPRVYAPALRFFVGLIVGDFLVGSFWFTYGVIMETPVYHFWPY